MKVNRDFELFKAEFKKWQGAFGLEGYAVYFKHEKADGFFARIIMDRSAMSATVILNKNLPRDNAPFKDIKRDAKHEAIHLLIYALESAGKDRFTVETVMDDASEELVHKLETLINLIKHRSREG